MHSISVATEDDRNTSAQRKERAAVLRGCRERVFFLLTVRKYRNWKDHLPEKRQMGQKRPAVVMEPGSVPSAGFQRIQQKQPVQPQSGRKSRIPVLEGFRFLPSGQAAERRFRSERFPQRCRRARGVPASPSISAPGRYRFPCRKKNLPSMTEWNPADGL